MRQSVKKRRCRCWPIAGAAIVLYTRHMSEKKIMSLIESIAMPLVVINRDVSQARERCVFFEQQDAAFQAVEYPDYPGPSRYCLFDRADARRRAKPAWKGIVTR